MRAYNKVRSGLDESKVGALSIPDEDTGADQLRSDIKKAVEPA